MGKIRVKMVGDEGDQPGKKQSSFAKASEDKKVKKEEKRTAKAPGMKGGERVVAVGPSIEELEKQAVAKPQVQEKKEETILTDGKKKNLPADKQKKQKFVKKKVKSKRYAENFSKLKNASLYPLKEALDLLKSFKKSSFDETVEIHVNVKEKGISGQMSLPHGTGKKVRIAVADDALIAKVEKGIIDFDVLIAQPQIMGKLAKVAKILGPRGLMPNPKAGTITNNPEALIEKLSAGQVNFKTEAQAPIIHLSVGKLSFKDNELEKNIETALKSIGINKVNNVTLKSTMSPGIKLDLKEFE